MVARGAQDLTNVEFVSLVLHFKIILAIVKLVNTNQMTYVCLVTQTVKPVNKLLQIVHHVGRE